VCSATAGPMSPAPCQRRPRYPSDTTDPEWALIQPLLPSPACTRASGGRPEAHPRREVVDAIRYLVHNGCVWRALPADFPPWRTVYGFFARWAADGTLARVHDALREQVRLQAGRNRAPSGAIIDSQSVRAADTVPKQSRGFDAAKKVNGRKRHLAVDTLGLLLVVLVTAASVQDRDGARPLCGDCGWRSAASGWCGLMPPTRAGWSPGRPSWACGSRSSAGGWPMPSRCCHAGGWWSAPLPGSAATVAQCVTTSGCPTTIRLWSPGR
jgi:transposase